MAKFIVTIYNDETGVISYKKVYGKRIVISGHVCFIHRELIEDTNGDAYIEYKISDMLTGCLICSDMDKDEAINKAKELISTNDIVEVTKSICKILDVKLPVNE
jgi:hypothetical protein